MKYKVFKQLFVVFLSVYSINLSAQEPSLKKIDRMLVNVDKATLTSNVLYERVEPWAMLPIFNC